MMEINTILLHLLAGLACGEKATCGDEVRRKVKHRTEKAATSHANSLNDGAGTHRVEPYPCPYCYYWHVGREMDMKRLIRLARRTVEPDQEGG
jgi:hypothetical protein